MFPCQVKKNQMDVELNRWHFEDNLVVFYYLSSSEICPDKRSGLIRQGLQYILATQ